MYIQFSHAKIVVYWEYIIYLDIFKIVVNYIVEIIIYLIKLTIFFNVIKQTWHVLEKNECVNMISDTKYIYNKVKISLIKIFCFCRCQSHLER